MNAHARIIEKSLILAKNYLDASGIIFYQINEDKKDAVIESDINVSKKSLFINTMVYYKIMIL